MAEVSLTLLKTCIFSLLLPAYISCQIVRNNLTGESWGYISVREGGNMFFMLDAEPTKFSPTRPLVMWMQGGPGASSTGFGNFAEIGPLDEGLNVRPNAWSTIADLLFVDSPLGAGFSYINPPLTYVSTGQQIDEDLYNFMKGFIREFPQYQDQRFYMVGVSYSGKVVASFGIRLLNGIRSGDIKCNLKGVIAGDSWMSPSDYVGTWASCLKKSNLLDDCGFQTLSEIANRTLCAISCGQFAWATELWKQTQGMLEYLTDEVNPYHILQHHTPQPCDRQSGLMNGIIRQKLGIIPDCVVWGAHRNDVFAAMTNEFMQPGYDKVGELLSMGMNFSVFQGEHDLLCDPDGTHAWLSKIPWNGTREWEKTPPDLVCVNGAPQMSVKRYQNLAYYYVKNSGHMVPVDNPGAALEMLKMITSG